MNLIPKPLRRHTERFMAEQAGRLIYGNLVGPSNNRLGRHRLRTAQHHAGQVSEVAGTTDLRREGCGFYSGIDRDLLATVREQYFGALDRPELTFRTGAGARRLAMEGEPVYRITLRDVAQAVPAAISLIDPEAQRFITSYYGANFRLHSMTAWRIFHVPADVLANHSPYSLLWHVDSHPTDTLKLVVALEAIGGDDGPLHFVSRPRTGELIRSGYRNRNHYGGTDGALEDSTHIKRLTGPAGTAAFCNTTTTLHRAGVPAPGHQRDILPFRFEAAPTPFDPEAPLETVKGPKPPIDEA
jgi:hypothetical protein